MKKYSSIHLRGIEFNLHLGWLPDERLKKQPIHVDVCLRFSSPPAACDTDDLKDTYCYDKLITALLQETESREFKLIEHLAAHLYQIIKRECADVLSIRVSVSKKPAITQLTAGVVFSYGDEW